MVIRTCALDSGTLTADTGKRLYGYRIVVISNTKAINIQVACKHVIPMIVRISHCGHFKYEGYQYSGCVQACDTDGCNIATKNNSFYCLTFILPIIVLLLEYSFIDEFLLICINFLCKFMQQFKTIIYHRWFSILRRFFFLSHS
uniref:ZP domain-containing protein n=1 Tax=Ascaris lumbricoides TaxID=6252 RepID=A0A0M3IQX4_ASCLU